MTFIGCPGFRREMFKMTEVVALSGHLRDLAVLIQLDDSGFFSLAEVRTKEEENCTTTATYKNRIMVVVEFLLYVCCWATRCRSLLVLGHTISSASFCLCAVQPSSFRICAPLLCAYCGSYDPEMHVMLSGLTIFSPNTAANGCAVPVKFFKV